MIRTFFWSRLLVLAALGAGLPAAPAGPMPPTGSAAAAPQPRLVDVNVASRSALMTLPGVTGAVADRIIAHRPYLSKAKLVSRNVISMALFQAIRNRIVVHPKLPIAQ